MAGTPLPPLPENIDPRRASRPLTVLPQLQPYADGPVFLHQKRCERYEAEEVLPPVLTTSPNSYPARPRCQRPHRLRHRRRDGGRRYPCLCDGAPAQARSGLCACSLGAQQLLSAPDRRLNYGKKPAAESATGFS